MNLMRSKWTSLAPKTRGSIYFVITVGFELLADFFLKYTEGCTVLWATALCAVLFFVSFFCFAKALMTFNLGFAYALWSGVGILFLSLVSVVVFHQRLSGIDIVGLTLILIGIIIMNVFGANKTGREEEQND